MVVNNKLVCVDFFKRDFSGKLWVWHRIHGCFARHPLNPHMGAAQLAARSLQLIGYWKSNLGFSRAKGDRNAFAKA
jgi:hypothetical protein